MVRNSSRVISMIGLFIMPHFTITLDCLELFAFQEIVTETLLASHTTNNRRSRYPYFFGRPRTSTNAPKPVVERAGSIVSLVMLRFLSLPELASSLLAQALKRAAEFGLCTSRQKVAACQDRIRSNSLTPYG